MEAGHLADENWAVILVFYCRTWARDVRMEERKVLSCIDRVKRTDCGSVYCVARGVLGIVGD